MVGSIPSDGGGDGATPLAAYYPGRAWRAVLTADYSSIAPSHARGLRSQFRMPWLAAPALIPSFEEERVEPPAADLHERYRAENVETQTRFSTAAKHGAKKYCRGARWNSAFNNWWGYTPIPSKKQDTRVAQMGGEGSEIKLLSCIHHRV